MITSPYLATTAVPKILTVSCPYLVHRDTLPRAQAFAYAMLVEAGDRGVTRVLP